MTYSVDSHTKVCNQSSCLFYLIEVSIFSSCISLVSIDSNHLCFIVPYIFYVYIVLLYVSVSSHWTNTRLMYQLHIWYALSHIVMRVRYLVQNNLYSIFVLRRLFTSISLDCMSSSIRCIIIKYSRRRFNCHSNLCSSIIIEIIILVFMCDIYYHMHMISFVHIFR
mgnify:CR=1 FL=1